MAADRIRQQMKKAQEQSKRAARMACRTEPAAAPAAAAASAGNAEDRVADVYWEGPRAIGWRLSVLWPDDQQMYSGKVTAWCRKHNFHLVTYDDGKPLVLSWNCVMQQPKHLCTLQMVTCDNGESCELLAQPCSNVRQKAIRAPTVHASCCASRCQALLWDPVLA